MMTRKPDQTALDITTQTLDAINPKIGPVKAATNTLKRRGWTDEQIKESVARYIAGWPRLDWVSHPIDREAIRTAAGDKTDTCNAYLVAVGENHKAQQTSFAGKSGQKEEGAANRAKISIARDEILKNRVSHTPLSDRSLARLIATATGIPAETVRGHLQKMKKMG